LPSIVGNVNINSNPGTFNLGDTLNISPTYVSKAITGQGGANVGNLVNTLNGASINNTLDPDVFDSNVTKNL
jgi:spore germination protein PF